MLKLEDIRVRYGEEEVLKGIDLTFRPGEVVVITGLSGCGKSTLIKTINGIVPQFARAEVTGHIYWKDQALNGWDVSDRSRMISTVFQNPKTQFYAVNTTDEIAFAMENRNIPPQQIWERMDYYTKLLGTDKLRDRQILKLSGGEKQMVAVTGVACLDQEIYIFDEPSSSLDRESIERLAGAIQILKDLGKVIIIAEHRLYYLHRMMDRLVVLREGKAVCLEKDEIGAEVSETYYLRSLEDAWQTFARQTDEGGTGDLLECRDFQCWRGGKLVLKTSMGFGPGVHFIIGKNGVGKTTFLRCLCGLEKRKKGELLYKGKRVKRANQLIALVMQDVNYQLFTESVWEEISLVSEDEDLKEETLKRLGLWEKKDCHPASLSGGEKQRLSFALCRASRKPIVILDEPTSGLCRQSMERTARFIQEMAEEGRIVLISTHDCELIQACRGDVTVIEKYKQRV